MRWEPRISVRIQSGFRNPDAVARDFIAWSLAYASGCDLQEFLAVLRR